MEHFASCSCPSPETIVIGILIDLFIASYVLPDIMNLKAFPQFPPVTWNSVNPERIIKWKNENNKRNSIFVDIYILYFR